MESRVIVYLYSLLYKNKNRKVYLFLYRCIKAFLNTYYPIHCKLAAPYRHKMTADNVIVSLTSFPARINSVWIIIETLLRQTYKPEKIILWLSESQFESKDGKSIDALPKKLVKLQRRGLEIKFGEDLRSHKKYYNTMKENPDAIVITVDDDTFYPEDLVENLLRTHAKFPNTVCCNIGHLITIEDGQIAPYIHWGSGADGCDQPSSYLVPIGCEGVLYPPGSLSKEAFNKSNIKELCPYADDLWLKAMATLNGVKAVENGPVSITYANLLSSNKNSLKAINVDQDMNDKQFGNILKRFPQLRDVWE